MPELYRRVAASLRSRIGSGEWPPGGKLPTKAALAEHYGVAQGTIQAALRVLRDDGWIETAQGGGIWALEPPEREPTIGELAARLQRIERHLHLDPPG